MSSVMPGRMAHVWLKCECLRKCATEILWVFYLDRWGEILLQQDFLARDHSFARILSSEVFPTCFTLGAHSVVFCHNHPQGKPTPTIQDESITRQIEIMTVLLGIELLDHIIASPAGMFSFRQAGRFKT